MGTPALLFDAVDRARADPGGGREPLTTDAFGEASCLQRMVVDSLHMAGLSGSFSRFAHQVNTSSERLGWANRVFYDLRELAAQIDELERKLAVARATRDALIVEYVKSGRSRRGTAEIAGVSATHVQNVCDRRREEDAQQEAFDAELRALVRPRHSKDSASSATT